MFSAASLALAAAGGLHLLGHLAGPPPQSGLEALVQQMESARVDMGFGMRPSMRDVHGSLSLTMTVTLLWLAAQNLVAAALDATGALLRPLAVVSALGFAVVELLFLAFLLRRPRA